MKKVLKLVLITVVTVNFLFISLYAKNDNSKESKKLNDLFMKSSLLVSQSPEQAISISRQILNIDNNFSYIAYAYKIIGLSHKKLSNYDSAIYYLNLSKQYFIKSKDTINAAMISNDIGIVNLKLGNFNKSLDFFKQAYTFFSKRKDSLNIASALVNMSISAKNLKEYEIALNYQIEVLKNYKKYLDSLGLASSYNNMANLYKVVGNYEQALKYYSTSFKIYKIFHLSRNIAIIDNNIGIIYKLEKKYKKALDYFEESLKLIRETNNKYYTALTLNNIAEVYELQEHYDNALLLFKQSLKIKKEVKNKEGIINAYVNIGRVYFKAKDFKNAKENFLKAVKLGGKSYLSLSDAYLYLSKISKDQGKIMKSLDYLEDYAEIQDSVVNPARVKRINSIINNFELSKKDSTIQKLMEEGEYAQSKISNYNTFIYGIILLIILISVIAYIFFSKLRIVTKMQDEEEKKNKELERANTNLEKTMNELHSEIDKKNKAELELINTKERLTASYKREKELNNLKTRFISSISHEYKNPLTFISTATALLTMDKVKTNPDLYNEQIKKINQSIEVMVNLLNDTLALSKEGTDYQKVKYQKFELIDFCNTLIRSTEELFLNNHSVNIITNNISKLFINSDSDLLYHILSNLLTNAFKYSPVNTEIVFEIIDSDNDFTIKISDEGIGIPEEDKKWLFEPFHRCKNTGFVSGNGLGLSIVKMNVELLKGKIEMNSTENEGSIFKFTLPKVIS